MIRRRKIEPRCEQCDRNFSNPRALEQHIRDKHDGDPHQAYQNDVHSFAEWGGLTGPTGKVTEDERV